MKISARNALAGTVTKVTRGAVNAEVDLSLKGGGDVVAVITNSSADSLGLKEGKAAYAIIKASSVMIAKDSPIKLSARNALGGTVASVQDGAVDSEVTLKLSGGSDLVAIITKDSAKSLGLKAGEPATAIVKASSVLVGVDH
ncbi:MAG: TOBE domain-containing protein [Candidatus Korobacteraceae bacterium]